LRWRHQLCYNSPSTSSFNLTENLFFRDVETPTDEWAAQQTVPENLVVTMLWHSRSGAVDIYILYNIYIYIYTYIY
jgi:hypothetical protein